MFAGPQFGWSWRVNSALELHAIGELAGGLATTTMAKHAHPTGGEVSAALGATWNTRIVFTSLEAGYAVSTTVDADPSSHVAQRGPFVRLSFGFSSFH